MTSVPRVAVAILAALALSNATPAGAPRMDRPVSTPATRQASTETRRYAIAARVRPVLFWIGRDSVGEARMTWLNGPNGERGYELLIGSDPARAPRRINQWGYVREMQGENGVVEVVGLMTEREDKEKEYDAVRASAEKAREGPQRFRSVRVTVENGIASAEVQRLNLDESATFRDVEAVLARVPSGAPSGTVSLPPGTQPGFLFAMTSLLRESVERFDRPGAPPVAGLRRTYVFGQKVYVLTTLTSKLQDRVTIKGLEYRRVINSEFEARVATEPTGDSFRVVYGTQGPLREVPIKVVYRPNFWFEAEIVLRDRED